MFKSIKKLMQTIKDCDVTPDNNTEPEIVINVENSNKKAKNPLKSHYLEPTTLDFLVSILAYFSV